jgi:hypothetical protein
LTLVLLIPYNQGCILLADRLNSFDSGSKQERKKILLQSANGPALGCAGDSRFIENLFLSIREEWGSLRGDSYNKFKALYEKLILETYELNKLTGAKIDLSIETILVEVQGGKIVSFVAAGLIRSKIIDCQSILAIPEDFPEVQQYLRIDSRNLSENEAIDLGEQILRQMCFLNYRIGPPEYHGYDFVRITADGTFADTKVEAKLDRLDPSQLIKKVRIEEEAT